MTAVKSESKALAPRFAASSFSLGPGKIMFWALAVSAITFFAYRATLFNFFCGDDYLHVEWLKRAALDPSLVLKNFHTTWLDDKCSLYYRPLISVFNYTDYLIWGENGLGFRITNILFLLAASGFLAGIIQALPRQDNSDDPTGFAQWAVFAALLFALYPLHPEAVAWITGRVDSEVAAFYLGGMWSYMRWRQGGKHAWLIGTALFMILALMSKEMGLGLPFSFIAYELVYWRSAKGNVSLVLAANGCFWGMIAIYFVLRQLFLGSIVGGYDSSLSLTSDLSGWLSTWAQGLTRMLIPINMDALGSRHWLKYVWLTAVAASAGIGAYHLCRDHSRRRAAAFFSLLFLTVLLPVYKVFNISAGLESSRYGYLASAPLCALLTIWYGVGARRFVGGSRLLAGVLLVCAFLLLGVNLEPWAKAGREANAIHRGLTRIATENKKHLPLVLLQIPDSYQGAYISRNAIIGMVADSQPRLWGFPATPFGLLRDELRSQKDAVFVACWDEKLQDFRRVNANIEARAPLAKTWQGSDLSSLFVNAPKMSESSRAMPTKQAPPAFDLLGGSILHFNTSLFDPAATHFIALSVPKGKQPFDAAQFDLHFANDSCSNADVQASNVRLGNEQLALFALHANFEWAFGERLKELDLVVPAGVNAQLEAVKVLSPGQIMPLLKVSNRRLLSHDGLVYVGSGDPVNLEIDASSVKGAKKLALQVTKQNYMFNRFNYPETKAATILKILPLPSLTSTYQITRALFPTTGFYELRAVALDETGGLVGVPGDHMLLWSK